MDDFMNRMGLGDPDPSNYKTGFDGADDINDWFQRDKPMTGGNVTENKFHGGHCMKLQMNWMVR